MRLVRITSWYPEFNGSHICLPPSTGHWAGWQNGVNAFANGGYSQNGGGRGRRGTFAHGSMLDVWVVCGREKLTFGELLFAPLLEYA